MGDKRGAPTAPPVPLRDKLGRYMSRKKPPEEPKDLFDEALDKFDKTGQVQIKFGNLGVYTISNVKTVGSHRFTPITIWWKAALPEEAKSPILKNSRKPYNLPYKTTLGQALQFNIMFPGGGYGGGADPKACAAVFINLILSGIPIHRGSCGVYDRSSLRWMVMTGPDTSNLEIEILP